MAKTLRLKVQRSRNGMVVLSEEQSHIVDIVSKDTGKKLTEKQLQKADRKTTEQRITQVHPKVRMNIVPLPDDKTVYVEGELYEVTLTKVK